MTDDRRSTTDDKSDGTSKMSRFLSLLTDVHFGQQRAGPSVIIFENKSQHFLWKHHVFLKERRIVVTLSAFVRKCIVVYHFLFVYNDWSSLQSFERKPSVWLYCFLLARRGCGSSMQKFKRGDIMNTVSCPLICFGIFFLVEDKILVLSWIFSISVRLHFSSWVCCRFIIYASFPITIAGFTERLLSPSRSSFVLTDWSSDTVVLPSYAVQEHLKIGLAWFWCVDALTLDAFLFNL